MDFEFILKYTDYFQKKLKEILLKKGTCQKNLYKFNDE